MIRNCGACREEVVQAFTDTGTAVLLDYPPAPNGCVAARIDGEPGVWKARFLAHGEDVPDGEVRFRQHTVTCEKRDTDTHPLILALPGEFDAPKEADAPRATDPPTLLLNP